MIQIWAVGHQGNLIFVEKCSCRIYGLLDPVFNIGATWTGKVSEVRGAKLDEGFIKKINYRIGFMSKCLNISESEKVPK